MTIQAFRIENFMAFEDTGWIELRPITLLFGRNSSGKSAIIRALRLLKQSLYGSPTNGPLVFAAEEALDQGSFLETVHNQRVDLPMVFHFRCRLGKSWDDLIQVVNSQDLTTGQQDDWADLSLALTWDQKNRGPILSKLCIARREKSQSTIFAAERLSASEWKFTSDLRGFHEEALWQSASLELSVGFIPALNDNQTNPQNKLVAQKLTLVQRLIAELGQKVSSFLTSMDYLGPIRPEPERVYTLEPLLRQRLRQRGLSAWLDFLLDQADDEQLLEIDQWLQRLGLGQEVAKEKDKYTSGPVTISEVAIHEVPKSKAINLKDMGFGASQVLPIIVHGVLAHIGSFTIIEQPELHLHPAAQGTLADFFIHQANCGKQFLLETHSEHLLLRFQRRIAETSIDAIQPNKNHPKNEGYSLKNNDFGLLFVSRADACSTVELIDVDHRGQLVKPSIAFRDFFRYDYDDVMRLTRATAEIMNLEVDDESDD